MINFENIETLLNTVIIELGGFSLKVIDVGLIPLYLIVFFFVTKLIVGFLTAKLTSKNADPNLVHLIRRLSYVVAITVAVFTILHALNIPLTAFAFLSGAIAIGLGFGAQNIINNFISGWILMWERPIKIGDFLEIDTAKGTVESINTRSTLIRRIDGVHMLIPNSKLLENTVINWTLVDRLVRSSVRVGVAYGSQVKLVSQLMLQAATEQDKILKDPKPVVFFDDFGDNSLVFEMNFWIHSQVEGGIRLMRSDLRYRMDELFSEHGIVIAFPQRDIHLDGKLTISNDTKLTN